MSDNHAVAALKRQRAHLLEVNADQAKVQENAELLRLAGVDVEELDKEEKPKPKTAKRRTTDAPTKDESRDVTGSGGLTVPKSDTKG